MERNILLKLKYDGSKYCGWQKQIDAPTIQETLENAIKNALGMDSLRLVGSSRTDSGVHAIEYKTNFICTVPIPLERIKIAVNGRLPADIRILSAEEVSMDFHARFGSKQKTYVYRIIEGVEESPFAVDYFYQVKKKLDVEKMKAAASAIEGTHDFASFQSASITKMLTTVRTVFKVDIKVWELENDTEMGGMLSPTDFFGERKRFIDISVTGDGFLYNMVRIIAGTLVDVGSGKIDGADMTRIIEAKERNAAGHTAPAAGLYLKEIIF